MKMLAGWTWGASPTILDGLTKDQSSGIVLRYLLILMPLLAFY